MGLFINNGEHPEVYKTKEKIMDNNQSCYKKDYFTDLAKEQRHISESISNLESLYKRYDYKQTEEWQRITKRLNELKERSNNHEAFQKSAIESFVKLNENNEYLKAFLENEDVSKQDLQQQLHVLQQSNQELVKKIEVFETKNVNLEDKINELLNEQKQITDMQQKQHSNQEVVLERLENQEALMEKATRQLTNLRSILYERTNYLVEKMESSYKLTSSLLYKLLTRSEQPLTFFYEEAKKIENRDSGE